jgi:hypothetical protein
MIGCIGHNTVNGVFVVLLINPEKDSHGPFFNFILKTMAGKREAIVTSTILEMNPTFI